MAIEYSGVTQIQFTYDKFIRCLEIIDHPALEFYYDEKFSEITLRCDESYDIDPYSKVTQIANLFDIDLERSTDDMTVITPSTKVVRFFYRNLLITLKPHVMTQDLFTVCASNSLLKTIAILFDSMEEPITFDSSKNSEPNVIIDSLASPFAFKFMGSKIDCHFASLIINLLCNFNTASRWIGTFYFNLDSLTLKINNSLFRFENSDQISMFVELLLSSTKFHDPDEFYDLLESCESSEELLLVLV